MNTRDGGNRPVYTIKVGGKTKYAREVEILGPCKCVAPEKPLPCGAKAWIETDAKNLRLTEENTFQVSRNPT